jgi:hypothetical protein
MLACGFNRRAGRRGRKRLGYNYKGRLRGLKSKTLTGTRQLLQRPGSAL